MSISLSISPRIIPSIASLYNDTNRIFMEYIDNSIDSAEDYFNKKENSYFRPIEIKLIITGERFLSGKVTILDSCFGITNFEKVVQSVGNSDKKAQPWTNGQFGYGIYSFMAACNKLEIKSKLKNAPALYIPIERRDFEADKQEDVNFPDPKHVNFKYDSGTEIVLSDFDKNMWKQISLEEIKGEIEKHFELLLTRKNLQIKLLSGRIEYVCKPFDYSQYEGEVYEDHITELTFTKGRKNPVTSKFPTSEPIHIFLKVTKQKTINKPPVFILKGRRISEIKDVKNFHSKHKSDIWGHPNMTGYIDLTSYLEPTIARNDFVNNDKSKALFNTLYELEPLILKVIKEVNEESDKHHYQILEDKLNQALSKLAKIDAMNFRTEYLSGNDVNLEIGGMGQSFEEGFGTKDRSVDQTSGRTEWGGTNEGQGIGPSGEPGKDFLIGEEVGEFALNKKAENLFEETGFKGDERKKSGFNIKIVDIDPPIDEKDKMLRSQLIGNDIRIFRKHSEFEERVDRSSRKSESRITQRLITYLAGEITIHYKDKLQTRHGQPEYNKRLFENLVEFIYQLESMLKSLNGLNLSEIND